MATRTASKARKIKTRQPIEGIYTAEEVAQLTGKTVATIRRYARNGALVRVKGAGMKRGIGYTAASVRALVEGKEMA